MCVATEIADQFGWSGERRLGINHPRFFEQPANKLSLLDRGSQCVVELQLPISQQFLQPTEELCPEHRAQRPDGEQELSAACDPAGIALFVFGQRPGSDQAMQVEVWPQLLIPSMQHQRESDLTSQFFSAERQQRLRRRVEQQLQQQPLIVLAPEYQRVKLMRQREYFMEVRHRQQLKYPGIPPRFSGRRLTLGAMAITATVIQVPLIAAPRAPLAMPAEQTGSAVDNLLHNFTMPQR